jgi:adenosylhomocysteine nucleosidase
MSNKLAILVAVEQEFRAVSKLLAAPSFLEIGGFPAVTGRIGDHDMLIAKSGMGAERARKLADVVIREIAPKAIIVAGFAAGLDPKLRPGDVVVPSTVRNVTHEGFQKITHCRVLHPEASLYEMASRTCQAPDSALVNSLLTYHSIVRLASHKKAVRLEEESPDVLDMESAAAAGVAEDNGVSWVVIRAITDGAEDDLPLDFTRFSGANGEVNVAKLAASLIINPWRIPGLIRLGKRSALAARNLGAFVERYVASLPTG